MGLLDNNVGERLNTHLLLLLLSCFLFLSCGESLEDCVERQGRITHVVCVKGGGLTSDRYYRYKGEDFTAEISETGDIKIIRRTSREQVLFVPATNLKWHKTRDGVARCKWEVEDRRNSMLVVFCVLGVMVLLLVIPLIMCLREEE